LLDRLFPSGYGEYRVGAGPAQGRAVFFTKRIEAFAVAKLFCFGEQLIDGDHVIVGKLCLFVGLLKPLRNLSADLLQTSRAIL
jgi:hypothetical protein